MANIIGNREWIKEWENRENGKSENQKEKDEKLYRAAYCREWDEVEKLLNEGATPDYVKECRWTAYYWTFRRAKYYNIEGAKKVLEKFDQKWKNEIEKTWTIWMAVEGYHCAADIINWTGKTEIVTNSKHPIIAILRMMGKEDWKEEYSRKIIKDLNLKQTLQNDLNFMTEKNITESKELKKNFVNLSKILKEFQLEVEYDESTKTFKTNFPLTKTDDYYNYLLDEMAKNDDESEDTNDLMESLLAQNDHLNEKITQLTGENFKVKSENRKLIETRKSFFEKILAENIQLKVENQTIKITQRADREEIRKLSTKISELKNQNQKIENELFEEKLFKKPSKKQYKEIEELFTKSRNAQHRVPDYKILV